MVHGPSYPIVPPTPWSLLPHGPSYPMVPPAPWSLLPHGPIVPPTPWSLLPHGPMVPPTPWSLLPHGPSYPMVPPTPWSLLPQGPDNTFGLGCFMSQLLVLLTFGTDLLRQFDTVPHRHRSYRSNLPINSVTVLWHRANQSQHRSCSARRLAE